MSCELLKENQGAVRMNSNSEAPFDIFTLEQPTGRPSILRLSQVENINKTAHKGVKVCFQTPRRDPVTKKIMSPSRSSRATIKEDLNSTVEYLASPNKKSQEASNFSTIPVEMESNTVSYPDDDMPIQSTGCYSIDLHNLDAINPFQGFNKMANFPPKSSGFLETVRTELVESAKAEVPVMPDVALDETLPFIPSVEDSLAECSANVSSAEGTVILKVDNTEDGIISAEEIEMSDSASATLLKDQTGAQESPLPSAGSYNLDFDNLEMMNPFQTGSSKILNSPLFKTSAVAELFESSTTSQPIIQDDIISNVEIHTSPKKSPESLPLIPSVENALAECLANTSSTKETVILKVENIEQTITDTDEIEMSDLASASEQIQDLEVQAESKESPLPPAGGYNLEFDNLEMVNPFQTGGSKILNSPLIKTAAMSDSLIPSQEVKPEPELSVKSLEVPSSSDLPVSTQESSAVTESSSIGGPKENKILLEFNFDDGAEVKRKPPSKTLGAKRPAGAKPVTKKVNASVTEKKDPEPKPLSPKNQETTEAVDVPAAKGSYAFDYDKFDDPNFNPFGTKAKMDNSPPRGIQTSPVLKKSPVLDEQTERLAKENGFTQSVSDVSESVEAMDSLVSKPEEDSPLSNTNMDQNPVAKDSDFMGTAQVNVEVQNQICDFSMATPGEEVFVPGAMFMPGEDFDGQIDYLEQFGSCNFKDSALRKQSLYLKFDPLLKESPKKNGVESSISGFSLPRPSLAIRMMEAAKSEVKRKSQCGDAMLLEDLPTPVLETVVPDPTVLDLLVPTLKKSVKTEDTIIEVLKYSQRDMDAALQRAEGQSEERQEELKKQIGKLEVENQNILFIASELEANITKIKEEQKQQENLAKIEVEQLLQEKNQLSREFNELDRSFSSIVKRLDRCKEVIEGFKKNEEILKQHSQSCVERLQKEEKRYQGLKAHAEEKLDQANKAIAELRSKQGVEVAALQMQLKREQLKVQSLEKDLEQKVKEVKGVTEICDELLLKVQKHRF